MKALLTLILFLFLNDTYSQSVLFNKVIDQEAGVIFDHVFDGEYYFIFGRSKNNILLVKMDKNGNTILKKSLKLSGYDLYASFNNSISLYENRIYITGSYKDSSNFKVDQYVSKLNLNLDTIWFKPVVLKNTNEFNQVLTISNNYIYSASTTKISNSQGKVISSILNFSKIDTNGNLILFKNIQLNYNALSENIFVYKDDTLVLSVLDNNYVNNEVYTKLLFLDSNANVLLTKEFPLNRNFLGQTKITKNGNIIIYGNQERLNSVGEFDGVVIKLDSSKNISWQIIDTNSEVLLFKDIVEYNGNFYLIADNKDIKLAPNIQSLFVCISQNGIVRYSKRINTNQTVSNIFSHYAYSLISTSTGFSFAGTGYDDSIVNGTNFNKPWIVSIDTMGCYKNCFSGISKFKELNLLSIFPNPATKTLTFEGITCKEGNYKIVNLQGQLVQEGFLDSTINIELLPNGLYYIQTIQNELILNAKFIKISNQ